MPRKLSMINGASTVRTPKCLNLHWQRIDTHKKHLQALEQILMILHKNQLKINLETCLFGDDRVSYLGFTLTPQGIKTLWAIKNATAPSDIKSICFFVGLCISFAITYRFLPSQQTHPPRFRIYIRAFTKSSAPSFWNAHKPTISRTYLGFPKSWLKIFANNQHIQTNPSSTFTQADEKGNIHVISYTSRQLKENKKNYSPFLLEVSASVWGMDNFNEYLKGSQFILYADPTPAPDLGTTQFQDLEQVKNDNDRTQLHCEEPTTINPTKGIEGNTKSLYRTRTSWKPDIQCQDSCRNFQETRPRRKHGSQHYQRGHEAFNHNTIQDQSKQEIAQSLDNYWFNTFGFPKEIYFKKKKGKLASYCTRLAN